MKFRKKPVVIDAEKFEDTAEAMNDIHNMGMRPIRVTHSDGQVVLHINTLEGIMEAKIGDWIIKGVNGEFYPCKPDIFEKTYERVE
jgi:hypothetical protein